MTLKTGITHLSKSQRKSFHVGKMRGLVQKTACSVLEIYMEAHDGTRDAVTHKELCTGLSCLVA